MEYYTIKLKLGFRAGGPDLPERRMRYTSSRGEDVHIHMCPCGTTTENRTHIAGYYYIYQEERDEIEMRKFDECDMEALGRLESSEKIIARKVRNDTTCQEVYINLAYFDSRWGDRRGRGC